MGLGIHISGLKCEKEEMFKMFNKMNKIDKLRWNKSNIFFVSVLKVNVKMLNNFAFGIYRFEKEMMTYTRTHRPIYP